MAQVIMDRDGETSITAKREIASFLMQGDDEAELESHIDHLRAEGGSNGEAVHILLTPEQERYLRSLPDFPYLIY